MNVHGEIVASGNFKVASIPDAFIRAVNFGHNSIVNLAVSALLVFLRFTLFSHFVFYGITSKRRLMKTIYI